LSQATAPHPPATRPETSPGGGVGAVAVFAATAVLAGVLAVVHLTQGTSTVGAADLVDLAGGNADAGVLDILVASRLPRLLAAMTVGVALGVAGAALQSLARNPLASPDTLAVNAGAHFAVVLAAALGVSLPMLPAGGLAFLGGLAAAALVLMLSAGGTSGPTRLILAGSATAMALSSFTMLFLLLFEQETLGMFAWGNGSLSQSDLDGVRQLAPVVLLSTAAMCALSHRLDILGLGDDTAAVLGLNVRRVRLYVVLLSVLLAAAAVTLAGPVGFVGLCAPVIVRLLGRVMPWVLRHRFLLPLSGLAGVLIMLVADVALRAVLGGAAALMVPTGVITTFVGATVLVWLARRGRDSGPTRTASGSPTGTLRPSRVFVATLAVLVMAVAGCALLGMLAGDTFVLVGDLVNWLTGRTGPAFTFVLDQRLPRVVAALAAGAALAIAGTTVQAVCRNPLAEPGILGITAGAGLGAVTLITFVPLAGIWSMSVVAGAGALVAFGLVYGLAWRGGLDSDRLVLVGIGVSAGFTALITLVIVATDPWNTGKALTWLSGSTYGRSLSQVFPVLVALLVLTPLLAHARHRLDLLALDEDTPRVLGVRLERTRLVALLGAALLTSTAVSAVGVIGFVGLVAPHCARAVVGARHGRVLPVAALLGAVLVSLSDTLGRTVIAPAQIPAGLVTAMVGTPYFVWLLWRSRGRA
jgi:ferric hydroxamate transport system permease protein